jgi:hypothetical protein
MTVASSQRFTRNNPCPVCGGSANDSRGKGTRCFGFISDDPEWCHCTREDRAGQVRYFSDSQTYAHRLVGDCRCGIRHDPTPSSNGRHHPNGSPGGRKIAAEYNYRDEKGDSLFQTVRLDPKDFRQRHVNGDGTWVWNLDGVRRVLYRLPDLLAAPLDRTVYVVEGEKDADRVRSFGLVATTNPMGAGKWSDEYSEYLRDRHIVILPDNDQAGHDHAQKVALSLNGVAATVKIVALPGLPDKGDVFDWFDADHTPGDLEQVVAATPPIDHAAPQLAAPRPQPASQWPDPPGPAAYFGLAGRIVAMLEPHTEGDPAALLLTTLVAFGSAVGSGPYFMVGATRHSLRDNALLVGATAKARKGDATQAALAPFKLADPAWANTRVWSNLSIGEGLIWQVRDAITKTERVGGRGEPTRYEEVTTDSGVRDKRLLVIESEFASCLKVMARQGNTLSPVIRQAWDTGALRTMTKNSPAVATGAHVSILGHITVEELRRELADVETINGFANRFLVAAVRRSKLLANPQPLDPFVLDALARDLQRALEFGRTVGQIRRSPEAEDLWCELYPAFSQDRPGLVGSLTARNDAHVLRLAAIYALLNHSATVDVEHLAAAVEVVEFSERSIGYIFGDATGDPIADAIRRALVANGELTRTQISKLFGHNVSAGRLEHALQLLLTTGRARTEQREPNGRRVDVWLPV